MARRDQEFGVGFLMGVLAGTVIGAGIGLLLAPKSGTELRAGVRHAAERSAEAFRKGKAAGAGEPELDEHA
jgi:gas vesicle protein